MRNRLHDGPTEAFQILNLQAKRFKALLKVRSLVRRVVGLTGTPSSNGLMDLWRRIT